MLHPFDSNFQHTKTLSCLIATINCHSCSQAKDKTEIDIFSFFIYFFEWDVQNLHHFSYLYVVCCDVKWYLEQNYSRIQSLLSFRNDFNLFLPSYMAINPIAEWFSFDINTNRLCCNIARITIENAWKDVTYCIQHIQCLMFNAIHTGSQFTTQFISKETSI